MAMKPKLAYVTHIYPHLGGYGTRITNQLESLSKTFEIHFFYLLEPNNKAEKIDISSYVCTATKLPCNYARFYSSSDLSSFSPGARGMLRFALQSVVGSMLYGLPLFFSAYYSPESSKKLCVELKNRRIGCLFAYGILGGQICRKAPARKKMLDLCDSVAMLYESMLEQPQGILKRAAIMLDFRITKRFELAVRKDYDKCSFISERDGAWLGLGKNEFIVLPQKKKKAKIAHVSKKKYDLAISGRWDYYPNKEYLKYALRSILPLARRPLKVIVMGLSPDKETLREIETARAASKNVEFTVDFGSPNYMQRLRESKIYLLSIKTGAGTCNKVLDGLEAGIPVLTSTTVARGIDPNQECTAIVACDCPEEYVRRISVLCNDGDARVRLGREAIRFFNAYADSSERKYRGLAGIFR